MGSPEFFNQKASNPPVCEYSAALMYDCGYQIAPSWF
jgi:hypothetical protein